MNKIAGLLLLIAVSLGIIAASPSGQAAVNSWSGQPETVVAFSQAITAGTAATVCTAVTSKAHNVRAITLTNTASGYVRLYSGTDDSDGSKLIGAWGVIANTPLQLNEDDLGPGVVTGVGQALGVDATTGTVSITVRVRRDDKSPRGSN